MLLYCPYMGNIKSFFAGLIPRHVSDGAVLRFLKIFSFRIPKAARMKHLEQNRAAWEKFFPFATRHGYIERQSALTEMVLGNTRADINSCEVIAVCNAGMALNRESTKESFPKLIEEFERRGIVFFGAFGTAPGKLASYWKEKGQGCRILKKKELNAEETKRLSESCEVYIVTAYNDRNNIMAMIHTMCITKEAQGYRIHNGGLEEKLFPTLFAAVTGINQGKGRPICLIGISSEP